MAGADVEFLFDSPADEARFVEEYLPEAWDRFEASDHWERGWFWSYGQFEPYDSGPEGGLIRLVFEGDPDRFVERESSRWDGFAGLDSWELNRYREYDSLLEQQIDAKGDVGGEWDYRLKPLVSRFSLAYRREFPDPLPAVGEGGEENPKGFGSWAVIHYAMVQCGYDWYRETDACRKAMANRLKSIASYRGADAAREEYERVLAEWQAHEEDLERWLDEHPTGEATEP